MRRLLLILTVAAFPLSAQAADPYLVSPDGQYLGTLGSRFDPSSVNNPYGQYGSRFSPDSINNPYGQYGSKFSNQSPHNPYATEQPRVINPGSGQTRCLGGSRFSC